MEDAHSPSHKEPAPGKLASHSQGLAGPSQACAPSRRDRRREEGRLGCDAAEPWEQIVWDQPSHSLLTRAPSRTLGSALLVGVEIGGQSSLVTRSSHDQSCLEQKYC